MDSSTATSQAKSVRFCSFEGCKVRLSAIDVDAHTLCPAHVGFLCEWDRRCDTCKEWTDSAMSLYLKRRKRLLQARIRKQGYKARKVGGEDFASCKSVSGSDFSKSFSPVSSDSESSVHAAPSIPDSQPNPTPVAPSSTPKSHDTIAQVSPEDVTWIKSSILGLTEAFSSYVREQKVEKEQKVVSDEKFKEAIEKRLSEFSSFLGQISSPEDSRKQPQAIPRHGVIPIAGDGNPGGLSLVPRSCHSMSGSEESDSDSVHGDRGEECFLSDSANSVHVRRSPKDERAPVKRLKRLAVEPNEVPVKKLARLDEGRIVFKSPVPKHKDSRKKYRLEAPDSPGLPGGSTLVSVPDDAAKSEVPDPKVAPPPPKKKKRTPFKGDSSKPLNFIEDSLKSTVPHQDSKVPRQDSKVPHQDSKVPRQDSRVPRQDSRVPRQDSRVPCQDSRVPLQDSRVPRRDSSVDSQDSDEDFGAPGPSLPADIEDSDSDLSDISSDEDDLTFPHPDDVNSPISLEEAFLKIEEGVDTQQKLDNIIGYLKAQKSAESKDSKVTPPKVAFKKLLLRCTQLFSEEQKAEALANDRTASLALYGSKPSKKLGLIPSKSLKRRLGAIADILRNKRDSAGNVTLIPPFQRPNAAQSYHTGFVAAYDLSPDVKDELLPLYDPAKKKVRSSKVPWTFNECDSLVKSWNRVAEIFSFFDWSIAVLQQNVRLLREHISDDMKDKATETLEFLDVLDRSQEHGIGETVHAMTNVILKKRDHLLSLFSPTVSVSSKSKLLHSDITGPDLFKLQDISHALEQSSKVNTNVLVLEAAQASLIKKKPLAPKPVLPPDYYGRGKPSSYLFPRGKQRGRIKGGRKGRGIGRGYGKGFASNNQNDQRNSNPKQ